MFQVHLQRLEVLFWMLVSWLRSIRAQSLEMLKFQKWNKFEFSEQIRCSPHIHMSYNQGKLIVTGLGSISSKFAPTFHEFQTKFKISK